MVLREEIRLRLWPNNTAVEFDHGINAAVQKLRDALGESADRPRYVETVARRGYRFLGEVERISEPERTPQPEPDGNVVSHYRLLEKLGEGGMGTVYRAEDLKLGRHVAVKFLPPSDGELPESVVRRFEREARAASALNHPNICTVHGFEEFNGRPAIVMELVEGETLAARLVRGRLMIEDILRIAIQIASALEEAHRKGVVHRDLKPTNIMLTKTGVKVLDFGLAKMEKTAVAFGEAEAVTGKGVILGTLHYMSPEQVQGKDSGARSDIFSLGVVLYEMVSGNRVFEGESAASVMAAILEREPPPCTPAGLDRVIRACLAKDPDERIQTARDLRRAIEWSGLAGETAPLSRPRMNWIPWTVASVFAAVALSIWLRMSGGAAPAPRLALSIVPPAAVVLTPVVGHGTMPEISPDSSSVMYVGSGGLWVSRLDSLAPEFLSGSQDRYDAAFWSADSKAAVFRTTRGLLKIQIPDGAPELISEFHGATRGGSWSDKGIILLANGGLYEVPASGGELKAVQTPRMKAGEYLWPQFLPGGDDFLFLLAPDGEEGAEIYLATLRDGKMADPVLLMKNDTAASYTPAHGGRILFVRSDNLYSQKLDRRSRKLEGEPELVQTGIASIPGLTIYRAAFSVSRSGAVVWRPGAVALNEVAMFDRHGKQIGTAGPPSQVQSITLSPNETWLLAAGDNSWLFDPGKPGHISLAGPWRWRLWSPDGSHLLGEDSKGRMAERSVDGNGEAHIVLDKVHELKDVSPDGKVILDRVPESGLFSIQVQGSEQDRTPKLVGQTAGELVLGGAFSPDGRWIVFWANGSIYVQPFPGPGLRTHIAGVAGFAAPVWRKDGKEIAFADNRGVWSVRVEAAGAALHFGVPELLFSGLRRSIGFNQSSRPLAVSRDGSRFYYVQGLEQPLDPGVIHVRMGWADK